MTKRPLQARSVKTREAIVSAAQSLVSREGVKSFTLDSVAAEAGTSKGAVLHHFRTKEMLIADMVTRELASIRAGRAAEAERLDDQPSRALIATIRQSAKRYADKDGFPTSLMLAAVENAHCLGQIRSHGDRGFENIRSDSPAPEEATVLGFAALGLLLSRALGFTTLDFDEGRKVFAAMERMARALD